jgi:hypothetical protein
VELSAHFNYVSGFVFQLVIPLRNGTFNTEMFSNLECPQDDCCDKHYFRLRIISRVEFTRSKCNSICAPGLRVFIFIRDLGLH